MDIVIHIFAWLVLVVLGYDLYFRVSSAKSDTRDDLKKLGGLVAWHVSWVMALNWDHIPSLELLPEDSTLWTKWSWLSRYFGWIKRSSWVLLPIMAGVLSLSCAAIMLADAVRICCSMVRLKCWAPLQEKQLVFGRLEYLAQQREIYQLEQLRERTKEQLRLQEERVKQRRERLMARISGPTRTEKILAARDDVAKLLVEQEAQVDQLLKEDWSGLPSKQPSNIINLPGRKTGTGS